MRVGDHVCVNISARIVRVEEDEDGRRVDIEFDVRDDDGCCLVEDVVLRGVPAECMEVSGS